MKKIVLLMLMCGLIGLTYAQETTKTGKKPKPKSQAAAAAKGKMSADEKASKQADQLEKDLALSADQKAKVKAAALVRITKMEAIKAKYTGQGAENKNRGNEMRAARKEFVDTVNGILTPDQQAKWKKMREEKKQKMKTQKGGKPEKKEAEDENEDVDE